MNSIDDIARFVKAGHSQSPSNCRILLNEITSLRGQLRTVQNAARTLALGRDTELQHLRENVAFDHRLRSEHESLQQRDALMTSEIERLEDLLEKAVARIKDMLEGDDGQAWKEARKFLELHNLA